MNTYKQGHINFIMYPTIDGTYVAACQELCLIREGTDQELLKYQIMSDAQAFIKNVAIHKLGEHLLNQSLPREIMDEFNDYRGKKTNENFMKWMENIKKLLENKSLSSAAK